MKPFSDYIEEHFAQRNIPANQRASNPALQSIDDTLNSYKACSHIIARAFIFDVVRPTDLWIKNERLYEELSASFGHYIVNGVRSGRFVRISDEVNLFLVIFGELLEEPPSAPSAREIGIENPVYSNDHVVGIDDYLGRERNVTPVYSNDQDIPEYSCRGRMENPAHSHNADYVEYECHGNVLGRSRKVIDEEQTDDEEDVYTKVSDEGVESSASVC